MGMLLDHNTVGTYFSIDCHGDDLKVKGCDTSNDTSTPKEIYECHFVMPAEPIGHCSMQETEMVNI